MYNDSHNENSTYVYYCQYQARLFFANMLNITIHSVKMKKKRKGVILHGADVSVRACFRQDRSDA